VYTQYTQRSFVPDYMGLWIGLLVAALGVAILLAGVVVAFAKPRMA
jgi:cell division protein FtsX